MGSSANHFGSEGLNYSYGNKGNYGMIDNSSVGQYVNRQYKDTVKVLKSDLNAIIMEEGVSKELKAGIDESSRNIPSIRKLIAHLFNVVNEEQVNKGDISLK